MKKITLLEPEEQINIEKLTSPEFIVLLDREGGCWLFERLSQGYDSFNLVEVSRRGVHKFSTSTFSDWKRELFQSMATADAYVFDNMAELLLWLAEQVEE